MPYEGINIYMLLQIQRGPFLRSLTSYRETCKQGVSLHIVKDRKKCATGTFATSEDPDQSVLSGNRLHYSQLIQISTYGFV